MLEKLVVIVTSRKGCGGEWQAHIASHMTDYSAVGELRFIEEEDNLNSEGINYE